MNQSIHQRRTLLSLHRRSGSQLPPEVMDGRVQRHAQSWRDLRDDDYDGHRVFRGLWTGIRIALGVWVVLIVGVYAAVAVLG